MSEIEPQYSTSVYESMAVLHTPYVLFRNIYSHHFQVGKVVKASRAWRKWRAFIVIYVIIFCFYSKLSLDTNIIIFIETSIIIRMTILGASNTFSQVLL